MSRRLLSTEVAAKAADVEPVTIRQWARRGYIHNYGDSYRALWDFDELEAHDRRRKQSRPRVVRRCA
jgi:predicted site-specific integrase-resolvase